MRLPTLLLTLLALPTLAADHTRLDYYLDRDNNEKPVTTAKDWHLRRQQILAGMQEAMGPLPPRTNLPPLDVKAVAEVAEQTFTRLTITFTTENFADGKPDRLAAHLFLPRKRQPAQRLPAVLALHPTSPLGKGSVVGEGKANREYALDLARRGYVVLCPDYPSFGDAKDFDFKAAFAHGRYASGTMKGIFNHMRCVDLLQSRDDVDPKRIAAIGHSLGGHNAMFLAAFDTRVAATVSSCGWTPFAEYYGGKIAGWTSDRYMPALRDRYKLDPKAVPFDFYEIVAALAPRPFFSSSPVNDHNFDVAGVRKAEAAARPIYKLLGHPDALQIVYPSCAHDFPDDVREQAYQFLDRAMEHRPAVR